MVNYSNGKVYKIVPTVEPKDAGDVYYGSTTKEYLSQRMDEHRGNFKRKTGMCNSKIIFEKYGVENCVIILLEAVNAKTNDELKAVEAKYIVTNACVNKQIPLRTMKEYKCDNADTIREYKKIYYEDNKDTIREKKKIYNEANADTISEKKNIYNEANKDTINERCKIYRDANRDKIREKQKIYNEANADKISEKRRQRYLKQKEQAIN
jgi:hypothetical protein